VQLEFSRAFTGAARIFAGLWRQPAFYKFLVFLSLVVAVRLIFYHMHYTYPKFGIRELGPGAPIGRLWAVNSLLIIFLVPLVGALTQRVSAYKMVIVGSSISAGSVFIMTLPPGLFAGLAEGPLGAFIGQHWLGLKGTVHPYYVMIFIYVVLLSVGEALWSPRLYEYSAAIAPKGQEASYMSLSYLPFFVAKFFVGTLSGLLLTTYCPETGPRNSQMLWLIIALTTMITPIGLLVFRRYIQVRESGRD
jgi:H+/gluconate symporter-like permease